MEFEYERLAMKGDPMPAGLDYVDATVYQGFAWLYKRYFNGYISKEQAKKEKQLLLCEYAKQKRQREREWKLCLWFSDLMKSCDMAAMNYAKNKTIKNADALCEALYRVPAPKGGAAE